jgi:hypothetical protein
MVQKRDHEERNMIGYNQYTQGYNKLFTQVIAKFDLLPRFLSHTPRKLIGAASPPLVHLDMHLCLSHSRPGGLE